MLKANPRVSLHGPIRSTESNHFLGTTYTWIPKRRTHLYVYVYV